MSRISRPRVTGSRRDSTAMTGAGFAAELACALVIAGALVPVAGALSLGADIRRGRERHRQDVLIGKLWVAVNRIPTGTILDDPVTGSRVSAERDGGWLILAITDPLGYPAAEATVTRYMLAFWAIPERPPLYRHLAGVRDMSPSRMRWQQRRLLAEFNARTSAAEVTTHELAGLLDQVTRTTGAHLK
jgi:hypothetical protein